MKDTAPKMDVRFCIYHLAKMALKAASVVGIFGIAREVHKVHKSIEKHR